jgi:hypothetical protein
MDSPLTVRKPGMLARLPGETGDMPVCWVS